ncbi:MAG: PTS sugar transporter subunit IIA [Chloroflexi bacterium]|nr:PTS sugar transporter subunit IIA [Chloroflexota bacterium]
MRPFRIVVAGHGALADAFVSSAQLICGLVADFHAVGLQPDESPESFADRLDEACGAGPVLILTDLVGGTPHNVALAASRRNPAAVLISGVNLAVLIEAATTTDALDQTLVGRLVSGGRGALADAASLVGSRSP